MTTSLPSRRVKVLTATAGALTAGLGVAGVAGALTVGAHNSSKAAVGATVPSAATSSASPYFVCVAYGQQWGVCIGPPTN